MFSYFANPARFEGLARWLTPVLGILALGLIVLGTYLALFVAPPDYQQGDTARIMYVHVPAAWWAMGVYGAMTVASVLGLVFRHVLADLAARAAAPIGASLTFLALFTGALWGKPMWGAYWVWDARLTSMLVLFLFYLGYMAIHATIDDEPLAARIAAIVCLVGAINLPIIKFSVDWWNTLHQPASLLRKGGAAIHPEMLTPLLVMAAGVAAWFGYVWLLRIRTLVLRRQAFLKLAERAR